MNRTQQRHLFWDAFAAGLGAFIFPAGLVNFADGIYQSAGALVFLGIAQVVAGAWMVRDGFNAYRRVGGGR